MLAAAVRASLVAVALAASLLGAQRALAQGVASDLDTGPGGVPAGMRALWSSAPVVDVDPLEPDSRSAGL